MVLRVQELKKPLKKRKMKKRRKRMKRIHEEKESSLG